MIKPAVMHLLLVDGLVAGTWTTVEQLSDVDQRPSLALAAIHMCTRRPAGGFPRTGPEAVNTPPQPGLCPLATAASISGSVKKQLERI